MDYYIIISGRKFCAVLTGNLHSGFVWMYEGSQNWYPIEAGTKLFSA